LSTGPPQGHQRKRQIGTLHLPCGLRKLAKRVAVSNHFQSQNISGGRPTRQRRGGKRDRRRQLPALFGPEGTVALICVAVAIALILFHHLSKRRERRGWRSFTIFPGTINRGDLAGNGRETEAIHH